MPRHNVMAIAIVLSSIGLAISTYFTAITYKWMKADSVFVPSFCRIDQRTCQAVVVTSHARVLGIPNSLFGQLYYFAVLFGALTTTLNHETFGMVYLGVSLMAVGLSLFLTYSLIFMTSARCILCFSSHIINLMLVILLLEGRYP